MNKPSRNPFPKQLRTLISFLCILLISFTYSLLCDSFPLNAALPKTDSAVFIYMGKGLLSGEIPYSDSFDHKGPVLYLLNAAGEFLSSVWGLWLIELLSLFFTFIFIWLSLRIFNDTLSSFALLLLIIAPLAQCLGGGNYTEEYALLPISVSMYTFLRHHYAETPDKSSKLFLYSLIHGITLSVVLLLRPNMTALWFVILPADLLLTYKNAKTASPNTGSWRSVPVYLSGLFVGLFIILLPFSLYFFLNNAFHDFIYSYFTFNFSYTAKYNHLGILTNCFSYIAYPSVSLSLLSGCFLYFHKQRTLAVISLFSLLLSVVFSAISGLSWVHYPMPIFPLSAMALSLCFKEIKVMAGETFHRLLYVLFPALIVYTIFLMLTSIERDQQYTADHTYDPLCRIIEENSAPSDKISVYGSQNVIYILSNRSSASVYSYQFPIADVDTSILDHYYSDLNHCPPKLIIITTTDHLERMTDWLAAHHYTRIDTEANPDIRLYKAP